VAARQTTRTREAAEKAPRSRKRPGKRRARAQRTTVLLRWCILATAVFVGFLYYQPLSSYYETRASLNERQAEVAALRDERSRLQARLADSSTVAALSREARRMNLVRPGERLFIVKGVKEWRRAHTKGASTIGGNG
jgi:cell division protein FtsB